MLRFAVPDVLNDDSLWSVDGAYLIGPDDQPARGDVRAGDGVIECEKRAGHAVGLCLPYDTGRLGRLMLQTCLLPDREQPYRLTVELARHRIKMFIAKCEEWQMFDLNAQHAAVQRWEEARSLFATALTSEDEQAIDDAAIESLLLAIDASERLAMSHAEILLHRRFATRAASSKTLGISIDPARHSPAVRDLLDKEFDVLVLPMRWRDIEVEEGQYNWEPLDRWVQWAHKQGKPIVAGPLLDFSKQSLPHWMYVWQHDYDTCRDLAYDHVEKVVERYKQVVSIWNLASGLHVNSNFRFNIDQMLDLTRMASLVVRQAHRRARTMIELSEPFGECAASNREAVVPLMYVDRVIQEGIRFDCIGVQLTFGGAGEGQFARDMMQISCLLDRFFLLELPVVVTAMGVPSHTENGAGGWWHGRWSQEIQARWTTRAFAVALSKPFVESIFWSNLHDADNNREPARGLIDASGRVKPAMNKLIGMRRRLRKPLGALTKSSVIVRHE